MNDNELYHYAQLQCYLAMMQMSLAAMSLGIDSCMIGGFEKARVDNFLNLTYPFETAVILSLGYKAHEPKYSTQRLILMKSSNLQGKIMKKNLKF